MLNHIAACICILHKALPACYPASTIQTVERPFWAYFNSRYGLDVGSGRAIPPTHKVTNREIKAKNSLQTNFYQIHYNIIKISIINDRLFTVWISNQLSILVGKWRTELSGFLTQES